MERVLAESKIAQKIPPSPVGISVPIHGVWRSLLNVLIKKIAIRTIPKEQRNGIQFRCIDRPEDWQSLLSFRLNSYSETIPYMLNELHSNGEDSYDKHSFIFGIWKHDSLIGSIRYTTWPFELSQLVPHADLFKIIPSSKREEYLELSRLLVKPGIKIKGVLPSLILYSGLIMCVNTPFRCYTGYAKVGILKKFGRFDHRTDQLEFTIPNRNEHTYSVLNGDFEHDFINTIDKVMPFSMGKFLARIFFTKRTDSLEPHSSTVS